MKTLVLSTALALISSVALAESTITISDAYARSSGPLAKAGAAFFVIENDGDTDDRLVEARSTVAARTELHTHIMEDGVARMREVEGGFAVPAGGSHALERGADHVMFMGLTGPFEQGDVISLTLIFEEAGEVVVEVPVDLERTAEAMDLGAMDHGAMDHGDHGKMNH